MSRYCKKLCQRRDVCLEAIGIKRIGIVFRSAEITASISWKRRKYVNLNFDVRWIKIFKLSHSFLSLNINVKCFCIVNVSIQNVISVCCFVLASFPLLDIKDWFQLVILFERKILVGTKRVTIKVSVLPFRCYRNMLHPNIFPFLCR